MKYHIVPGTLEPRVCTAEVGACPYGDRTVHVDESRIEQHYRVYESVMADYTLLSHRRSGGRIISTWDHVPGAQLPKVG